MSFWFGRWLGRSCPFCEPPPKLLCYGHYWQCPDCDTRFDDSLDPIGENLPPSLSLLPTRRTCQELSDGRLVAEHEILCRQCQHQQTLLVQLLAACEEGRDHQRYQEELEQRYPLCAPCQRAVQDRLAQIDYRLRIKSLGVRGRREVMQQVSRRDWQSIWFKGSFILNCLLQAWLCSNDGEIPKVYRISLTVASLLTSVKLKVLPLTLLLAACRFLAKPHFDLVGVAVLAMMPVAFSLEFPKRAAVPEVKTQKPLAKSVSKTDDLLSSLSALSTSSPSARANPHFHRPFTALIKPEPVKMNPAKFSFDHRQMIRPAVAVKNPFGAAPLKPATLPVMERASGLEGSLGAFSLRDAPLEVESVWQVALTVALMIARYFLHSHPPLVTLLLAACFCWRGFLWDRLRAHGQLARLMDTIIGARLFWMSLSLLNQNPLPSSMERWASFLVDLLVIAVR